MEFNKPSLSIEQQIELLESRGLNIPDAQRAVRYLQSIGYYRLSAYTFPFQKEKDKFIPGTTFNSILGLYIADRKLRLVVMDALERIEVAIRAAISNVLSSSYSPHWYLEKNKVFKEDFITKKNFWGKTGYEKFLNKIAYHTGKDNPEHRNASCKHYYDKYTSPELPPCWMVIEVLPMGTWSKIFPEIRKTSFRKKISRIFNFEHNDFGTWIHALTLIRNKCAHHGRFWNHNFPHVATNIKKYTYPEVLLGKPYTQFALIHAFLSTFTNNATWSKRLYALLSEWPLNIHSHMGFPEKWQKIDFWKINK